MKNKSTLFIKDYLEELKKIAEKIDIHKIEKIVNIIANTQKKSGRIFFIGVGGSAANTSHAVNDFRKIAAIECYAPMDNVSEISARTNDNGWNSIFSEWLKISKINKKDILFIFSVGGGDTKNNISTNIIEAIDYTKKTKAKIIGIVGSNGGYTKKNADECLTIPLVNSKHITPHTESFQAVIWHLIVSHPKIKIHQTKWESVKK